MMARTAQIGLLVAIGLWAALCARAPAIAADGAIGPTEAQASLLAPVASTSPISGGDAKNAYADFVRRLDSVNSAVGKCQVLLDGPAAGILNGLRQKPGGSLFTTSETVDQLSAALGGPVDADQFDLELCAQIRDEQGGAKPHGAPPSALAPIGTSLSKCLSALNAVGPNAAGTAVLQGLSRAIASETFTSRGSLTALEQAVGRDLGITPTDFETCVDAYAVHARVEHIVLGDNPPPCNSNQDFCQGTAGNPICCDSSNEVCDIVCGARGACFAGCQPKWCFPGDATVRTEAGATKAMRDVRIGDRLLVARPDGTLGYEDVYLNTHKDGASSAPFVALSLASGRSLTLSPRHFIPVAGRDDRTWQGRVERGADEIRPGDLVWSQGEDGRVVLDRVVRAEVRVAVGAYNPLTMNGTIIVDGVVSSAHSDWFLDGIVSPSVQARVYQVILAPARVAYWALGPTRMEMITEDWGVVDFVRTATTPSDRAVRLSWAWPLVAVLTALGVAAAVWRRRPVAR